MSDEWNNESQRVIALPLYALLDMVDREDVRYLTHEIKRAAEEFGYFQMGVPGESYGQPWAYVEIRFRQPFNAAPGFSKATS